MDANAKATQATNTINDMKRQLPELQIKVDGIPSDIDAAIQAGNIADDASKYGSFINTQDSLDDLIGQNIITWVYLTDDKDMPYQNHSGVYMSDVLYNAHKKTAQHGVTWLNGLVHWICVLMAESSECGFEPRLRPWCLCP